jgi:hypothetical protein
VKINLSKDQITLLRMMLKEQIDEQEKLRSRHEGGRSKAHEKISDAYHAILKQLPQVK